MKNPQTLFRRAVRKLHAMELDHLRELVAEQQAEIEHMQQVVADANRFAEFWQEHAQMMEEGTPPEQRPVVGLTKAGELLHLNAGSAL